MTLAPGMAPDPLDSNMMKQFGMLPPPQYSTDVMRYFMNMLSSNQLHYATALMSTPEEFMKRYPHLVPPPQSGFQAPGTQEPTDRMYPMPWNTTGAGTPPEDIGYPQPEMPIPGSPPSYNAPIEGIQKGSSIGNVIPGEGPDPGIRQGVLPGQKTGPTGSIGDPREPVGQVTPDAGGGRSTPERIALNMDNRYNVLSTEKDDSAGAAAAAAAKAKADAAAAAAAKAKATVGDGKQIAGMPVGVQNIGNGLVGIPGQGLPTRDSKSGGNTIPGTNLTQGSTANQQASLVKAALAAPTEGEDPDLAKARAQHAASAASGSISAEQAKNGPRAIGPGGVPMY